jgi:serine/threonine protein kinase
MKNVMLAEPGTIVLFGGFVFFLAFLLTLIGAVIFLIVHLSRRKKSQSPPPRTTPFTQNIPRQCPQCGAELKPDVSEGLCPACLLQRGIATEGGAPPGTPPFVPPTIPDLARLFPQLEILELIGKGGMGAVYKARQPALDRFVALKILAPRSGGDLDFAERFTREARALAKLSHPNIVGVYDFGRADLPLGQDAQQRVPTTPLHYFIMEFVDGPNLRQIEQAGKLSPREALEIIPQICAALQFAHDEGIVHRDIKPENILLDKRGRVKIADFGLAKILGQEPKDFRLTGVRDVVGTPHYMSPEQIEKPQTVDHRADIYSLGVVFYEMLTGELPLGKFQPPSSCARGMQIDVRLDEVVLRSLEKEPERRYQQVSEVKTRVETIANSQGGPVANAGATLNPSPGRDYRTKQSFFGLPLVHVAWGVDPVTHRPREAKGLLAVGPKAKGLIAVGIEAYGLMAAGLIAGGIFPVGLLAFGVLSVGLVAYGIISTGLLAIALIHCVGLVSLANHSVGLVHFGIDAPVFFLLGLPIAAIWFLWVICSTIKRVWQAVAVSLILVLLTGGISSLVVYNRAHLKPGTGDEIAQTIQHEVGRQLREAGATYDALQVTVAIHRDSATPFKVTYRGLQKFKGTDGTTPDANGEFIMEYIGGGQWQGKLAGTQFTVPVGSKDNIDLPFVNDPQVIGEWESVDFVADMPDFNPDKQSWTGKLFFPGLTFQENGKTTKPWLTWTKGVVMHHGDKTASHYEIREIKGQSYLFLEWKSGDVMVLGMKPSYYVLKKKH